MKNAVLTKLREHAQMRQRFRCPQSPDHGFLLAWSGVPAGTDWYCPHFRHTGRAFYSQREVEAVA